MNPLALDPSPNLNHTFQIQLQPTSTALTLHHVITDLKAQLESGVVTVGYHWYVVAGSFLLQGIDL